MLVTAFGSQEEARVSQVSLALVDRRRRAEPATGFPCALLGEVPPAPGSSPGSSFICRSRLGGVQLLLLPPQEHVAEELRALFLWGN